MSDTVDSASGRRENPPLRGRALRALPFLLMAAPVVAGSVYVSRYGVDAPYNDGVTLIPLFEKLFAGELAWSDLFAQHNEHRILFPRLALLALGLASGFDDVAAMYAIQAFLLLTAAALFFVFRRTVSASPWLFVPVPFLVFNLGQSWNLLQGFQLTLVFVQTFTVLAFALLTLPDRRSALPALPFAGALGCGAVAAFSSAPGLLVWPLGFLQLAVRGSRAGRLWVWAAAGAAAWALYLRGYESSETTSWRYTLEHPLESAEYLLTALGASLFHGNLDLALAAGVLMLFIGAAALALSVRAGTLRGSSFWLAALGFAGLTLLATTLARGVNLEDALNPKYATYSVLIPISLYALLIGACRRLGGPRALVPAAALCALVATGLALSYPQGVVEAREIRAEKSRTEFVLATHRSQPDEALASKGVLRKRFRTDPGVSRQRAAFLESRRYSVFSDGSRTLPPALPDPSPGPDEPPDPVVGEADWRVARPAGGERFLLVTGWASHREAPVDGVYAILDGKPYPAFYGASRKAPGRNYTGFERAIPVSELEPGPHELSVAVVAGPDVELLDLGSGKRRSLQLD